MGKPEEAVPEEAVAEEAVPEEAVAEEAVAEEAVPEEAVAAGDGVVVRTLKRSSSVSAGDPSRPWPAGPAGPAVRTALMLSLSRSMGRRTWLRRAGRWTWPARRNCLRCRLVRRPSSRRKEPRWLNSRTCVWMLVLVGFGGGEWWRVRGKVECE